jgi:hypothetical protein
MAILIISVGRKGATTKVNEANKPFDVTRLNISIPLM